MLMSGKPGAWLYTQPVYILLLPDPGLSKYRQEDHAYGIPGLVQMIFPC